MASAAAGTPPPSSEKAVVGGEESLRVPRRSTLGWLWGALKFCFGLFRGSGTNDFEKRLKYLTKEEVAVRARLRRRTARWRKTARMLILSSVVLELLAIGIAVVSTRGPPLSWQDRLLRVGPVFLFPILSTLVYSACSKINRIWDTKDADRLQKLTTERQTKIEELKEKTNYYATQQLIQRYDTDPNAKAAAAQVLVSKLGLEAGLKVQAIREDSSVVTGNGTGGASLGAPALLDGGTDATIKPPGNGRVVNAGSGEFEAGVSAGTMRRRTAGARGESGAEGRQQHGTQGPKREGGFDTLDALLSKDDETVEGDENAERRQSGSRNGRRHSDGAMGWLGRLAALLVGEDPTQCYALICNRCHAHNGLVPKEDYQVITYFCPHCKHLNGGKNLRQEGSSSEPLQVPLTSPNTPRISLMGALDDLNPDVDLQRSPRVFATDVAPQPDADGADFSFTRPRSSHHPIDS